MAQAHSRSALIGNRWVLIGAIVYLSQLVALFAAGAAGVGEIAVYGLLNEALLKAYVGNVNPIALVAAWFSVCQLGRAMVFIGLRSALIDSGHSHPLMDFAVVAATVGVTLEIAQYGLATAAAGLADPADTTAMLVLDAAAVWLNQLLIGGLGVAILGTAWCLWRSGLFSKALCGLGLIVGLIAIVVQFTIAPATRQISDVLRLPLLPLLWVWMIWIGVVAWRHTPTGDHARVSMP